MSNILVEPSPYRVTSGVAVAATFGIPEVLIAVINDCIVVLGTVTDESLIRIVLPGVNIGLATVDVVTPYILDWFT